MMDNKQSDLVIMGIDPGTSVLGYSIIRSSGGSTRMTKATMRKPTSTPS